MHLMTFIDFSRLFWYLEGTDPKGFLITISSLSLVTISMFSLYEYISCSPSTLKEDIKLISANNWIIHVTDFLKLLLIFWHGLIFSMYCSDDDASVLLLFKSINIVAILWTSTCDSFN